MITLANRLMREDGTYEALDEDDRRGHHEDELDDKWLPIEARMFRGNQCQKKGFYRHDPDDEHDEPVTRLALSPNRWGAISLTPRKLEEPVKHNYYAQGRYA